MNPKAYPLADSQVRLYERQCFAPRIPPPPPPPVLLPRHNQVWLTHAGWCAAHEHHPRHRSASCQLQTAEERRQRRCQPSPRTDGSSSFALWLLPLVQRQTSCARSNKDTEPRRVGVCGHGGRHRADRDPSASPASGGRQGAMSIILLSCQQHSAWHDPHRLVRTLMSGKTPF